MALLTGRRRAYGYFHCERILAQVAHAGGDERLTDTLATWTATLWPVQPQAPGHPPPAFYLDGHKKPVYTDRLIPRGLIGRTGKILGCRALMLLHDAQGHPLFAARKFYMKFYMNYAASGFQDQPTQQSRKFAS